MKANNDVGLLEPLNTNVWQSTQLLLHDAVSLLSRIGASRLWVRVGEEF
jgi:hypothetical protein